MTDNAQQDALQEIADRKTNPLRCIRVGYPELQAGYDLPCDKCEGSPWFFRTWRCDQYISNRDKLEYDYEEASEAAWEESTHGRV